jgi:ABC-type glutathione transport system ATPase component
MADEPAAPDMTKDAPILEVRGLVKHFPVGGGFATTRRGGVIRAVDGVSFDLRRGETLGLVGESGCGKSTVARTLLRLEEATAGQALFHGRDIFTAAERELKDIRRRIQVIFQDPYASLNPRMRVADIIGEPWVIHRDALPRAEWPDRVRELLESVGLRREHAERRSARKSWSATSRSPPSTCRCRRRSSTCWRKSRRASASPMSSSPTTFPWCGTCRTGSR